VLVAHEIADRGVYTPRGGRIPWAARAKCERLATSVHGTIPARMTSRPS